MPAPARSRVLRVPSNGQVPAPPLRVWCKNRTIDVLVADGWRLGHMACLSGLSRERTGRLRLHQHRAVIPAYTRHALNQAPLDSSRRTAWCGKASFGLALILSGSAQTDALTRFAVFDTLNIVLDAMLLMDILVRSLTAPCPNEHASWLLLVASSLGAAAHFEAQLQARAQACIPANCACRCLSTYVPSVTRAS